MKIFSIVSCLALLAFPSLVRADQTNVAEDDASQEAYKGGFDSGKMAGAVLANGR